MPVLYARHRCFTVAEYHRMAEAGILTEDDPVELIDGEIVEMTPAGSQHAACVKRLNALLNQRLGNAFIIAVQDPVRLSDTSEPEPDLAVLEPRPDYYAAAHPTAADARLLVEVADSSVVYDREVKAGLYARAAIPEYWLIDLTRVEMTVFTRPGPGGYERASRYRRGDGFVSEAVPGLSISVDELLG